LSVRADLGVVMFTRQLAEKKNRRIARRSRRLKRSAEYHRSRTRLFEPLEARHLLTTGYWYFYDPTSPGGAEISEGAASHFVVQRYGTGDFDTVTVNYTIGGTATTGVDDNLSSSGSFTIGPEEEFGEVDFTVTDDNIYDPNETITMTVTSVTSDDPNDT